MKSILFVCTANICRSPMAEGVLRKMVRDAGVEDAIEIESVATHDYHAGKPPFHEAVTQARRRGYDIAESIARRIKSNDFDHFDLILAMDRSNLAALRTIAPTRAKQKIELFLEYGDRYHGKEVPDPYGGQPKDFERALDMIEDGCKGIVEIIARSTARR